MAIEKKINFFGEEIKFIKFTIKEKFIIFYRLLKTKYIQSGYSFEEIIQDGF